MRVADKSGGSKENAELLRPHITRSCIVIHCGSLQFENGFHGTNNGGQRTLESPETAVRFGIAGKTELRLAAPNCLLNDNTTTRLATGICDRQTDTATRVDTVHPTAFWNGDFSSLHRQARTSRLVQQTGQEKSSRYRSGDQEDLLALRMQCARGLPVSDRMFPSDGKRDFRTAAGSLAFRSIFLVD
jgi:hypothetical protein